LNYDSKDQFVGSMMSMILILLVCELKNLETTDIIFAEMNEWTAFFLSGIIYLFEGNKKVKKSVKRENPTFPINNFKEYFNYRQENILN
jgi:hypothetical protein